MPTIAGRPASSRHAAYLAAARFPSLDGLRFFSIVPVIWHHATPGPLPGVLGKGPLGVDLFFAISGFLITTLMLRERRATGALSVSRFYARRCFRIFPLYYAVLALYTLRAGLFLPPGPMRSHFFASLPFWATYTSDWFVDFGAPHPIVFGFAWSLAVEEQFYLLWPWIVRSARGWLLPAATAALLLAIDQAVEHGHLMAIFPAESLGRRMASTIASPICMGALLAIAMDQPRSFAVVEKLLGRRWSAPLALALLAALIAADGVPLWSAQLAMTLLVGACCIRPDHGLRRLTDAGPLCWVGTVSYGMYLLHVSAITAAKTILPEALRDAPRVFALAFPATLLLAAASYRWFERPFLRFADRYRTRQSTIGSTTAEGRAGS